MLLFIHRSPPADPSPLLWCRPSADSLARSGGQERRSWARTSSVLCYLAGSLRAPLAKAPSRWSHCGSSSHKLCSTHYLPRWEKLPAVVPLHQLAGSCPASQSLAGAVSSAESVLGQLRLGKRLLVKVRSGGLTGRGEGEHCKSQ